MAENSFNKNAMEAVSFRRFLSYIYAYEDEKKLRNVGFAKVEIRNQRIRLQVIVSGICQKGSGSIELCLVDENRTCIPVDRIQLQNGRGEFRGTSSRENLWNSGLPFSRICGICLKSAGNRNPSFFMKEGTQDRSMKVYYMTLWKEFPAGEEKPCDQERKISEKKEGNAEAEMIVYAAEAVREAETVEIPVDEIPTVEKEPEKSGEERRTGIKQKEEESEESREKGRIEIKREEEEPEEFREKEKSEKKPEERESELLPGKEESGRNPEEKEGKEFIQPVHVDKRMELWKKLCSRYPHVDIRPVTDMGTVCEVLRIRPNDIGRLPRNNWILSHNSFLQNAYHHSHQLILFRLESFAEEEEMKNRWFLGFPGEYVSQEILVAEVFGFKRFLKCRNGGYWYTEIYMGNVYSNRNSGIMRTSRKQQGNNREITGK